MYYRPVGEALYYVKRETWDEFHTALGESHYEVDDLGNLWVYASGTRTQLLRWEQLTHMLPVSIPANRKFNHPILRHYAAHP